VSVAYIYTPGLKVMERTEILKERRLPLSGEILVRQGDAVAWDTVVARTFLPGRVEIVKAASLLGIEPRALPDAMTKAIGDKVEKGEILARSKGFMGLFSGTVESPGSGVIETISSKTGQVIIRGNPVPVETTAFVDGTVEEVLGSEGVTVRCLGAYIQGILGVGGEAVGNLAVVTESPQDDLDASLITPAHSGKIIAGGSHVALDALHAAVKTGVKGVITGAIDDAALRDFMGFDLGVAVTGSEELGLVLIITEGFGKIAMAERTWRLLRALCGRRASICGATQIRAGVLRPDIVVPNSLSDTSPAREKKPELHTWGLSEGAAVRIIRSPHFGRVARVSTLPPEPRPIPTGARVRVLEVAFEDGEKMMLPRANVEVIDQG
jgi:hypothetical protein